MNAETFVRVHETLCVAAETLGEGLRAIAKENPLACLLVTVVWCGLSVYLGGGVNNFSR